MKRRVLFASLLSGLLLVTGCGSAAPEVEKVVISSIEVPGDYSVYEDDLGWSLAHPGDWSVDETAKEYGTIGFVSPSAEDGFKATLGVLRTEHEFMASDFNYEELTTAIQGALENNGGMNVLTEVIELPAGEAARGVADLERDGVAFKTSQVQIYGDGVGYILTFTTLGDRFEEYIDEFENMLATFAPGF